LSPDLKDKIVRLIINIPASLASEIEMDKIKKCLSDAHLIAGISRNVEKIDREKIDIGTEIESLTPIQALRTYFKSKKYPAAKQKELEEYAAKLLEN